MKIISYNVNGIRAAISKGFVSWLQQANPDIICLQEIKATPEQIPLLDFELAGYPYHFWFPAEKKGYSGVAVFTKIKPDKVEHGNGHGQSDDEGRVIQLHFGKLLLINAYFPSGTSGEERQSFKMEWLNELLPYLNKIKNKHEGIILCGDYNIAHKEIDIHDPKGNKNTTGFLPEERAWMDTFFTSGWTDSFREIHPEPHRYSWWSQRFPSVRLNNKGWRIDYINVTNDIKSRITDAEIFPDIKHSDHCPVFLKLSDK